MNDEKKLTDDVRTFVALFVEFDEMGFAPTTTCPNPEEYARDWKMAMLNKVHRLQDENAGLKNEKEEIRLFNLSLQNGEVDMRIESEMAKSFYNSIVQVFEQNGAKNFFTTTIDIEGKNGRYAFTIEKVGGQTVAEKLAEQKAEIERLKKRHGVGLLRNDDLDLENYELKKQVDELEQQLLMAKLQGLNEGYNNGVQAERNAQIFKPTVVELPKEITAQIQRQAVKGTVKEILILAEDYNCGEKDDIDNFMLALKERYGVEVE